MTATDSNNLIEAFGRGWNRFWFTPADPLPCCVLRICVGALAVAHLASLGLDLDSWYGSDGLLPPSVVTTLLSTGGVEASYRYSYVGLLASPALLWTAHVAAMIAAAMFAAGFFTRTSGVLTLIAMLAYVHRAPQIAGHLEPVLAYLIAYLTLAPSGASLSLDNLRRQRAADQTSLMASDPQQPSAIASVGLRLIQVHTAMFYAMMGLSKLYGDAWWEGSAIWLLLAQTQSRPLDLTGLRRAGQWGEYLLNFWTHAIVYFELALPILIWHPLTRRSLVAVGTVVWLSLILATGDLLFGLTMVVATAGFLPVDAFQTLFARGDNRVDTRRLAADHT